MNLAMWRLEKADQTFKPGLMSREASKIIARAFSERSHADYDDFKQFEQYEVEEIKKEVQMLLTEINHYLNG